METGNAALVGASVYFSYIFYLSTMLYGLSNP
jgi:hypothetical protein